MGSHCRVSAIWVAILAMWAIETTSFGTWALSVTSIYDALKSHGLPMGLLPEGVNDFKLSDDGKFEAYLEQPCNAKFESEFHYDRNVSGELGFGYIRNLTGVSAQDLFLWFPVKGVRVDIPNSGIIYFDVGVVYKQFSASLFEKPRICDTSAHPNGLIKKLKSILQYPFNHGKKDARDDVM